MAHKNNQGAPTSTSPALEFKYWAFISYSQLDAKWAKWLHRKLEGYRVPKRLVAEANAGEVVPRRISPVFLDREEFGPGGELGEQVDEALRLSRNLIVVCSPNSAASRWVNEEVKTFKASGREDRIFCLIVDGEPNASALSDSGLAECFPKAIRFHVDEQRRVTTDPSESLAADARPDKDGKRNAALKLVAGVLGVGFDTLRQREQQRRIRRLAISGVAMAVLVAIFAGLAYYANDQRRVAERQRDIAFARQLAAQGSAVYEDQPALGLRLALEAYAFVPDDANYVRGEITDTIHTLSRTGRLTKLGDDVQRIFPAPDGSVFVVDHERSAGRLCRGSDRALVTTLNDTVNRVDFNRNPVTTYFVVDYGESMWSNISRIVTGELRRAADGGLVAALSYKPSFAEFSPDPAASFVAVRVAAEDGSVLHRSVDGEVVAGRAKEVVFDPRGARCLVMLRDSAPELRRGDDMQTIATLEPDVRSAEFSPDPAATYVIVRHEARRPAADGPRVRRPPPSQRELATLRHLTVRRSADGTPLALTGKAKDIEFSPGDGAYFAVHYDETVSELRRTADGGIIATLPGKRGSATFSPEPGSKRVVLEYADAPTELRDTSTGALVGVLGEEAYVVGFTPDGTHFVKQIDSETPRPELRRSADGDLATPLAGEITSVLFGPGPKTTHMVVVYLDRGPVLYSVETGTVVAELSHSEVRFSPSSTLIDVNYRSSGIDSELRFTADGSVVPLSARMTRVLFALDASVPYFVVAYDEFLDRPDELRDPVDGSLVATLSGTIKPDYTGRSYTSPLFVIEYADGRSELWEAQRIVRRLAELDLGLAGYHFDTSGQRLYVWYSDGRAFVLDLDWLVALGGDSRRLSVPEIRSLVCEGVLDASPSDVTATERYLDGRASSVCL